MLCIRCDFLYLCINHDFLLMRNELRKYRKCRTIPVRAFAEQKNLPILILDNDRHSLPFACKIQQIEEFELPEYCQKICHVNNTANPRVEHNDKIYIVLSDLSMYSLEKGCLSRTKMLDGVLLQNSNPSSLAATRRARSSGDSAS